MEIIKKNNYRLCTISSFAKGRFVDNPVSYGLAIEKETILNTDYAKACGLEINEEDKHSYYVICFVKYDEHDCAAKIEDVGTRLLDIENDEWSLFKSLLKSAVALVETSNIKED